jgi:tetratricopeptide (TPR) repeat protein
MESAVERENANDQLMKAKILMSVRRTTEAEEALAEAEAAFRTLSDMEMLSEVLIAKSQINLCLGHMPKALSDIEEALKTWQGNKNPAKRGQLLLYRGLAFLAMGREEEAHVDLDEFVRLSEFMDDSQGQFLGHFYHALVYERHGEPCMATAELEVGKDTVPASSSSRKGRMDAFLAHLWLRRGELDEARDLECETLNLILGDIEKVGAANLGMAYLVRAEILAMNSRYEESEDTFKQAIVTFRRSRYGLFYEALANSWYGETLMRTGQREKGGRVLGVARNIYSKLSNETQMRRIDARMADAGARR